MHQRPLKRRLFRTVGTAACLLAVLTTLGGHWLVLQSFAWASMIGQFARHGSLRSAIVKTFDGKHPCGLCLTIQHGRQQEEAENKKLPSATRDKTSELLCEARRAVVPQPPVAATPAVPTIPNCHTDFIESPPSPPPRAA